LNHFCTWKTAQDVFVCFVCLFFVLIGFFCFLIGGWLTFFILIGGWSVQTLVELISAPGD